MRYPIKSAFEKSILKCVDSVEGNKTTNLACKTIFVLILSRCFILLKILLNVFHHSFIHWLCSNAFQRGTELTRDDTH